MSTRANFIICRASAGSGKTYRLVKQYLKLAFSAPENELHNRFKSILAITFTNKAANEMKDRVLSYLDEIIDKGMDSSMAKDLRDELSVNIDTLRRYAEIVSTAILHSYSDLAICTIDSFTHHIVRTFAHDLGVAPNFEVMIDPKELIQESVDGLMSLAGSPDDNGITNLMCDFSESLMEEKGKYNIESAIKKLAEEVFKEDTPQFLNQLQEIPIEEFRNKYKKLKQENKKFEEQLELLGCNAMKTLKDNDITADDLFQGKKGIYTFFVKIANGDFSDPSKGTVSFIEENKSTSAKCSASKQSVIAGLRPKLESHYHSIEQLRHDGLATYNSRKVILDNLYTLAMLNKINAIISDYYKENGLLHISEFNKMIAEIVQKEPAPFIYERIGNKYQNYLIDEFQDTSKLQWQNLVPLLENGVSNNNLSLIVGDGKQAIYRFRKGDVEQFNALPHVDSEKHGKLLEQPDIFQKDRLDYNRRSAKTIVDFNNNFFSWAAQERFADNEGIRQTYIGEPSGAPDLVQKSIKGTGYVQVGFYDDSDGKDILWEQMLNEIRQLVDEKGYQYRDIAILSRKNDTLSAISSYLASNNIPLISSESFLISNSKIVQLICAMLRHLVNPHERLYNLLVLEHLKPLRNFDIDTEQLFLSPQPISLEEKLKQHGINIHCEQLRSMSLYDCCEQIVRCFKLEGYEQAYLATFLGVVANYTKTHRDDISEFLEWFDKQKEKISTATASNQDAVQLMTIHKSKGLEAPIVLYPILKEKANNTVNLWVDINNQQLELPVSLVKLNDKKHTLFDNYYAEERKKAEMDDLNVLYVALTRPKEKLFIYCEKPPKEEGNDYISLLHSYAQQHLTPLSGDAERFDTGEHLNKASKTPKAETFSAQPLKSVSYPDWTQKIRIANQNTNPLDTELQEHIQHGIRMHEILASVTTPDDIDDAIAQFSKKVTIDQSETERLKDDLETLVHDSQCKRFFEPGKKVMNEQSIHYKGETLRPDRIILSDNETWVVDFKTGSFHNQYRDQIATYCAALTDMGLPNVKGCLLFIGDNTRVEYL